MVRNRTIGKKFSLGFTLIDLILFLTVVGLSLAMASPHFVLFSSSYKLRGAAREVATDLQYTRLLAVKENRDFQVVFNSQSYQVVRASDGYVAKSRNFSSDYPEVTLSGLSVPFNSRGNSSSRTIAVSNARGTKNVSINSTGRVKIE
ncbi:MAG: GspH/FimT family pseudopilin [Deltaproteobacteria bacterium]|nr:GspH/FimT family pseudopilin [Deltaproteobacteria bacterium]